MFDPKNGNMDPGEENLPEDFESEDELIELIDEEGKSTFFEHLATLEYKNQSYLFLCDPESQEDSTEVIVLRIEQDDQGQDIYVQPEDDLAEEVFEYPLSLICSNSIYSSLSEFFFETMFKMLERSELMFL